MSTKSKVLIAIVVIIAIIIIFDPFGDDIEGTWQIVSVTAAGKTEIADEADIGSMKWMFRNDGTCYVYASGNSKTISYTHDGDTIVIEGSEYECEINGDTMKWYFNENGEQGWITFKRS